MKIKSDFITNSSSTSFILILHNKLTERNFLNLFGIKDESPLRPIFLGLYIIVRENMEELKGSDYEKVVENSPGNVSQKIKRAKNNSKKIYSGSLSSEAGILESYFATDSFELEDQNIYFNALENSW